MTTFDVITDYEQDTAKCSDLLGSNLLLTCVYDNRPPAKAYRIQVNSKNKYDTLETPIKVDKFIERVVRI